MVCSTCGAENPATNRFCGGCGARLATETVAPPPHLAAKIVRSRAALEGEHKQITALFADVVNSTPLAARLGPEETHALIRRCFDLMLEAVHQYEGTVSQFTGDGILALFGAPIAHEDHAQRAVRAGLAIQQALGEYGHELQERRGIALKVRIGLNSGPVVVGTIGTDLNMTYTAIGDTVNLASRIQGLAEPGTVVVGDATLRLVGGYFVTRPLGQHQVKGKDAAIGVHEVLRPSGSRSRLDVYVERGLSPLVGRERELRILEESFARARDGHGAVVCLAGDPGIGKSRLLHELKRRLEGEHLVWREGRCIAYGRDISYLPIIDVLKDSFDIREADDEAEIIRKTDERTRTLGAEVLANLPFLKFVLSVDPGDPSVATMNPQMRRARTFEALRSLALASSVGSPLVLVIEDLHWMDRLSEEVLSYLIDAVAGQRILLLLTFRPGYQHPFSARPYSTELRLDALTDEESAALAGKMLDAERLPDELQRIVAGKAEGNPFFIEEVVKSLLEIGVLHSTDDGYALSPHIDEIYVPDTVQDVIMARLDRLDEEPKRALQTAAVIGREFGVRLLERTAELQDRTDTYLRELRDLELIYERSLHPEPAYMFKHALTHDVAYNSLLVARRRPLHGLVADGIEVLYRDRLTEQFETLAYHYEQAEVWEKALEYLEASAMKALAAFAPHEAVALYERWR
jgi:class 3 adenylate cyclase